MTITPEDGKVATQQLMLEEQQPSLHPSSLFWLAKEAARSKLAEPVEALFSTPEYEGVKAECASALCAFINRQNPNIRINVMRNSLMI